MIVYYEKYFYLFIILFCACKIQPGSDRHYADNDPNKVYHLRLNPVAGSRYSYTIRNESEFNLELDGKKVDNQNQSTVDVTYTIGKDSAGDMLLNMVYDKIHLHTKNGDTETDMDTNNAGESLDPVEKMLSVLKGSVIQVVVSPTGEMKALRGYDEIRDKVLAGFSPGDTYSKAIAGKQWDQRIKEGLIKKNMEQLFKIFPDSAVHVGDKWKLSSRQQDEINFNTNSSYTLKEIENGTALIRSEGTIIGENEPGNMSGYDFTSSLKGIQEGEFKLETKTGMLLSTLITSEIQGTMIIMSRDIPITIHTSLKMDGKKLD